MANPTKSPCRTDRGHSRQPAESLVPRQGRKSVHVEAYRDAELLEAIRIGRETLGDDHPLVRDAIKSLASKERRRVEGRPDGITAAVSRPCATHKREQTLAQIVGALLGEHPVHEAHLPGFGKRRVDLYFAGHRLVVEDNGSNHARPEVKARDAELRTLCASLGLALLEFKSREPLTVEHLTDRLRDIGVAA